MGDPKRLGARAARRRGFSFPSWALVSLLCWLLAAPLVGAAPDVVGFVRDVRGTNLLISLGSRDGLTQGQEVSVLQYDREVARARVTKLGERESTAAIFLAKPDAIVHKLDTVVPVKPETPAAPDKPSEPPKPPPSQPANPSTPPPPEPAAPTPPLTTPAAAQAPQLEPVEPSPYPPPIFGPIAVRPPSGWLDIVPLAGWTYDALSLLASEGLLPGFGAREFHGDQLFTRREVAELTVRAASARETRQTPISSRAAAALGGLARLYRVEVNYLLGRPLQDPFVLSPERPGVYLSGHLRPRLRTGDGTSLLPLFEGNVFADLGSGLMAAATVTNQHREWQGMRRPYPYLDKWLLQFRALGATYTLGKDYVRQGAGYTGSLMWGEDSPAVPMLRSEREVKLPLIGRWKLDQLNGTFTEFGRRKYVGLRSLKRSLGREISIGWAESYKADRAPNPTIGFLPYLAYQEIFSSGVRGINRINVQEGLEIAYHSRSLEAYGEVFVDDMTAPSIIGSQGPVPRKLGYMVGARLPRLLGDRHTDLRVEFVRTDRNTYLHRSPSVSLYQRGLPLGHNIGPNTESLFLRANHKVNERLELTAAFQTLRASNPGLPNRDSVDLLSFSGAYDFAPDRSVAVRIAPRRVRGIGGRRSDTELQLVADYAF